MPANAIDLTWLNAVKQRAEVGVQPDGTIAPTTDDNEIQAAITAFSRYVLGYCGVTSFSSIALYDEIYNGNGNKLLMVRNPPVINLSAVVVNGVGIPVIGPKDFNAYGAFIDQSKLAICLRGGSGSFQTFPYPNLGVTGGPYGGQGKGPVFAIGQQNVELAYAGGYPPTLISNEVDNVVAQTVTLQYQPWAGDSGVLYYPSLVPLANVPNSPAVGEYAVSNGLYVFNVGDNGRLVAVSYLVNGAPSDLEYAVRCIVAINYKRKGWQDQGQRDISAGGGAHATTSYRSWKWPKEYQDIIERYKNLAMYA